MSNEKTEYTPLKLIVQAQKEASIGLVYKPSKSSDPLMIYKIILKNIYQIENPTRDGIKERIFADHPFLQRTKQMEDGIEEGLKRIFKVREERIQQSQTAIHENKEGSAAKIPSIKNK